MVIFNSYVSLPEGTLKSRMNDGWSDAGDGAMDTYE